MYRCREIRQRWWREDIMASLRRAYECHALALAEIRAMQ